MGAPVPAVKSLVVSDDELEGGRPKNTNAV
jgi:hypothetical protein